ncbi:MAG: hypothetical protein ACRDNS_11075, partial [Trebonia sp.]
MIEFTFPPHLPIRPDAGADRGRAKAAAAGEQAREAGVWLNCHAQNPESIKLAVRSGFRSIYH